MSVFGLASSVAAFVKVKYLGNKEIIDTFDFRLHYRFTSAILFFSCVLCTATSLIGDPISCIVGDDKIRHAVTTYCWITSTFTVPRLKGGVPGKDVAAHNVGPHVLYEDSVLHHNYYQWVTFVLFFQGLLFYAPHWIWKKWEGQLVKKITDGLRGPQIESLEETKKSLKRVASYFKFSRRMHTTYAIAYTFCVALNFINTIGNMYLINSFLGGTFLQYGTKVLELTNQQFRNDAMEDVFPKITKCTFHKYGPSGSLMTLDVMCVLALNVLNEKIYIFLWFWLIILAVISSLGLLYTLAIMMCPAARQITFRRGFKINTADAKELLGKLSAGDFLLLHFIGQNMRSAAFSELLEQLCKSLKTDYESVNPKFDGVEMMPLYATEQTYPNIYPKAAA